MTGSWAALSTAGSAEAIPRTLGNQCATPSGAASYAAYWTGGTFTTDQEVYFTIGTKPATSETISLLIGMQQLGHATVDQDGYQVRLTVQAGTDKVDILRLDNYVQTLLFTVNIEFSAGDKLGASIQDDDIVVWRHNGTSWSEIGRFTDTTYRGTSIGIRLFTASGTIDDFGGGSGDTSTARKTFSFPGATALPWTTEGGSWAGTITGSDGFETIGADTVDNSPNDPNATAGELAYIVTGQSRGGGTTAYFEWSGTYEDLGVPSGAQVTRVVLDYDRKPRKVTGSYSGTCGPATLRDSGGSSLGTFSAGESIGGGTAETFVQTVGAPVVRSLEASNTSIKLRIECQITTSISGTNDIELRIDRVIAHVDYVPASGFVDSATERITLTPAGIDGYSYSDVSTIVLLKLVSGPEVQVFAESATCYLDLQPSGSDIGPIVDTGSEYLDLQPSSVDIGPTADAGTGLVRFLVATGEIIADTIPFYLTPLSTYEAMHTCLPRFFGEIISWVGEDISTRWFGSVQQSRWSGELVEEAVINHTC